MIRNVRGWQVTQGFIFVHNQPINVNRCAKNLNAMKHVGDNSVILRTFNTTAINLIFAVKLAIIVISCVDKKNISPMRFTIVMLKNAQ